jgi:hypothetical protein
VAQLLIWAIVNVVWFCAAGFMFLFGLMDEFTEKRVVFAVLIIALLAGLGTFALLIRLYGW